MNYPRRGSDGTGGRLFSGGIVPICIGRPNSPAKGRQARWTFGRRHSREILGARPALVRTQYHLELQPQAAEHAEAPGKNRCLRLSDPSALEQLGSGRAAPLQ